MGISDNTAFSLKTMVGTGFLAFGSYVLYDSSGFRCHVPAGNGQYVPAPVTPSLIATAFCGACFFYTGFSLAGRIISRCVTVQAARVANVHQNRAQ